MPFPSIEDPETIGRILEHLGLDGSQAPSRIDSGPKPRIGWRRCIGFVECINRTTTAMARVDE
jgi:hypothetical protein